MRGVLLLNLGSPGSPTAPAIRRWLRQFLHDRAVVDTTRWIWCPVLYGIILPLRPRKLVPLYARIWTAEGSPLLVITRAQQRDRKSTRLNSSHWITSRMPSSA